MTLISIVSVECEGERMDDKNIMYNILPLCKKGEIKIIYAYFLTIALKKL